MIHKTKRTLYRKHNVLAEFEGVNIPKSFYGERKRASVRTQLFLSDCDRIAEGGYDIVQGGLPR